MDPDKTLAELRELIAEWNKNPQPDELRALGSDIVDRIEALDEWLKMKGFLPTDWQR